MKELLIAMVEELVNDKEAVQVTVDEPNAEGVVVYHLHVAPDDMGRVIGKQGRIARAIRTIMRAGAVRYNQKIAVEMDWGGKAFVGIPKPGKMFSELPNV